MACLVKVGLCVQHVYCGLGGIYVQWARRVYVYTHIWTDQYLIWDYFIYSCFVL